MILLERQDPSALGRADAAWQGDKEVVLAAVQEGGYALRHASEELRADREVVLAAVGQAGSALQYADATLKADKEVVLAAVQQNSYALHYASEELRTDREVVMVAMRQDLGLLDDGSVSWDADTFDFYQSVATYGPVARSAMVDAGLPTALFKAMLEDRDLAEDGSTLLRALLGDRLVVPELAAALNAIGQASPFKVHACA